MLNWQLIGKIGVAVAIVLCAALLVDRQMEHLDRAARVKYEMQIWRDDELLHQESFQAAPQQTVHALERADNWAKNITKADPYRFKWNRKGNNTHIKDCLDFRLLVMRSAVK